MSFFYIKALHIIFVVTWFSGMFYLCRLFIYQREAIDKPEAERNILLTQFAIMTSRLLYAITLPSAIITLGLGISLLFYYPQIPGWLLLKMSFVLLLFLYHISLHVIYKKHSKKLFTYTSHQLRVWNEVPTVLLISIVMLVVVREKISIVYGLAGIIGISSIILVFVSLFKKRRNSKN
ncbi:MAG: protoporphyrinogen IX oxidase [Chitinophaga sp.]|jgi:putative membrane protein|nr:protoporphyrinogen IX oxidase [Chitinophaga sp.]